MFYQKLFVLVENALFTQNYCFLVQAIILFCKPLACSRNHSIQWKLFPLMEHISFIGSYFFYQKPFILVESIPFNGSHLWKLKPFLLGKAFAFFGNHCPQLKPFRLVEVISFQCFNIFVSRSCLQLHELLNMQCQIVIVLDY